MSNGTVSGTTGNDVIAAGFVDIDGDQVDAKDALLPGVLANDDLIEAGASNDTLDGGSDSDQIDSGTGDDNINGGEENDTVRGGGSNDIVKGSQGDDKLSGGTGQDTLRSNEGNGSLIMGDRDGNDLIYGGKDAGRSDIDTLVPQADTETAGVIVTLSGSETGSFDFDASAARGSFFGIEAFELTDYANSFDATNALHGTSLAAGAGDDSVLGGMGDDTLKLGAGADTVEAGTGNDTINLGSDSDSDIIRLDDGDGQDVIQGFATPDAVGDGTYTAVDLLDVSAQTDLDGSPVNTLDVMVTANGNVDAILTFPAGEQLTLVGVSATLMPDPAALAVNGVPQLDFEVEGTDAGEILNAGYAGDPEGDVIDGADAEDGSNDDLIRAAGRADLVFAGDGDDIVYGGKGDDIFVLEDMLEVGTGAISIDGGNAGEGTGDILKLGRLADLQSLKTVDDKTGSLSGSVTLDDGSLLTFSEIESIICFGAGTRFATARGARCVEDLQVGDLVVTRDHGLQPIRWMGTRTVPAKGDFAPIRIRPGVLKGQENDIVVSPQHRMLFQGYRSQLLFGESEVLVAAKHLVDGVDVTIEQRAEITYVHILFDIHEIIFAEGAASESFHPGEVGLCAVHGAAREELFALFPDLRGMPSTYGGTARRCLQKHEALLLE